MTLECGRIAGVPVRLHWSALIVAAYLAYSLGTTTSVVAALVGVIGFGLSILGHEVGHALIARRFGLQPPPLTCGHWAGCTSRL